MKQHKAEIKERNIMKYKPSNETIFHAPSELSTKKRRKKDKSAGLLYTVNKDDNSVKKTGQIIQKLQISNIQKKSIVPSQSYKTAHQSPGTRGKLQNQTNTKHKKIQTKHMKNVALPVVKRNTLLQLANALKSKSNQSGASSQTDKLKQLLK